MIRSGPQPMLVAQEARPAVALRRRIVVGLVLALVGIGSVFWVPTFGLLLLAISIGCLWELSKLAEHKGQELEFPVAAAAVTAYLALTSIGLIHRWEGTLLSLTVIAAFVYAFLGKQSGYIARSAFTLLGVLYIGKLISYFMTIRLIPFVGVYYVIDAIFIIALTDIMCMAVGMTIGRTPLTPISPKKTVEGAAGGFLIALMTSVILGYLLPVHIVWWQGIIIGAITSLAAQAGDLVESALKRDAAVKDAGSAISGHGGVLDRFDSYLFGGIAFYGSLFASGLIPFDAMKP